MTLNEISFLLSFSIVAFFTFTINSMQFFVK